MHFAICILHFFLLTPRISLQKKTWAKKTRFEKYNNGLNFRFVQAVISVESSGSPFRDYPELGTFPTLRFEPDEFNKRNAEDEEEMPYTEAHSSSGRGLGFSRKASETGADDFHKAMQINESAAIRATFFGKYQIMGFNYKGLGYESPQEFLEAMKTEDGQDEAFIRFVMRNKYLRNAAQSKTPNHDDFYAFAKSYNGPSNAEAYSQKISRAYEATHATT